MASTSTTPPDPRVKVRAAHILVKSEEEADALMAVLENGADFAELAMVESDCPSRKQGGDLGWFGPGQMVPAFEEVCFNNPVGALAKVQTEFGYHIIQVNGKATAPGDWHPSQLGDLVAGGQEGREEVQLIDVREPDELLRAEIKGAGFLNLPLSQFAEWRPKILSGELLDKDKKTVVLCHHGGRSMQFASFLTSQAGFTEVYNLSGGIHMYAQLVDSRIPTY
ncbi:hypothetical protein NSK_006774 [Nannochloropsis salina CCMP1776]|uniref:Peptidyl-prolyl cis-trans isomerase n=1 Tax=Nannochloropsis salina CCMP1776 TaxID=1027361 RepID=A0A4D9D039_9STRA|nr:hypothetical protein NSK_006774 [Nannochloropsis salina CCMP1776]|eukprot:TFJ82109.1 hypothetical protein NSK_006774 [Nannochloropsis salina CCMP1776]